MEKELTPEELADQLQKQMEQVPTKSTNADKKKAIDSLATATTFLLTGINVYSHENV